MRKLGVTVAAVVALTGAGCTTAGAEHSTPPAVAFTINNVDLHDGSMITVGSTYYLYGTEYGCGFTFLQPTLPWCGMWVRQCTVACQSDSNGSNWTDPTDLIVPSAIDPYSGHTWEVQCDSGNSGFGCFNSRMVVSNGTYTLWFSGTGEGGANGYEAFSCSSPMGPCTTPAPGTNGGKPYLYGACGSASGDFTVDYGVMFCTTSAQTLSEDVLNNGYGTGDNGSEYTVHNVGGLTNVEAPGSFYTADGKVGLTYSTPNCAYCSSDNTGQSEATDYDHPFVQESDTPGTPGQPRTVVELDYVPYQMYDLWNGSYQETDAGLEFVPNLST